MRTIKKIALKNYRNFHNYEININGKIVGISGPNGSGKTNILEAVSLFYPGRGIRSAKFEDIASMGTDHWSVELDMYTYTDIKINMKYIDKKRSVFLNDKHIRPIELGKFIDFIYITPQMDILTSGSRERRKFLDRIVFAHDYLHAERLSKYEKLCDQRIKYLLKGNSTAISYIENEIATLSYEIASCRVMTVSRLHEYGIEMSKLGFTEPKVEIHGVENSLESSDFLNMISDELYKNRNLDKSIEKTSFGIHKTDVLIKYNGFDIKLCSTGQQWFILISLTLSQVFNTNGKSKILLLDEIFNHLDSKRCDILMRFFNDSLFQIWFTGADIPLTLSRSMNDFQDVILLQKY